MKNKINVICGTTASGKTAYGVELAKKLDGIVINADSMQIYKEIPILTAQPTEEEKQGIEHKLYGVVECGSEFSVGKWIDLVIPEIKECIAKGKTPILVGGTGMYIKSLIEGLVEVPPISQEVKEKISSLGDDELYIVLKACDPLTASRLKANDSQRIIRALEVFEETGVPLAEWQQQKSKPHFNRNDFHLIRIDRPREVIYDNINKRFLDMLDAGALEEVEAVYKTKPDIEFPKAHGLPEIIKYINGETAKEEMISKSQQNVRNYAKRQLTWFKNQLEFDEIIYL